MKNKIIIVVLLYLLFSVINCSKNNINKDIELVLVNAGTFIMGNNIEGGIMKPEHKVKLTKSFYISKYEITLDLYNKFCQEKNKIPPIKAGLEYKSPAIHVNWYDALEFCNWLSKKEKLIPCYKQFPNAKWGCDFDANGYRLPTEAEWEYAAKGGNKSRNYKYSGSNDYNEVGWHQGNSSNKLQIVGLKKPNELGIYDMTGNVWEWCWEFAYNYEEFMRIDPRGPELGSFPIKRGGSYKTSIIGLTTTFRNSDYPFPEPGDDVGFRVVRNAE